MHQDLLKKIDQEIKNCRLALAQDTIRLIQIDSTQQEPSPGAPFGKGAKEVLDTVTQMGKTKGFYATDYDTGITYFSKTLAEHERICRKYGIGMYG